MGRSGFANERFGSCVTGEILRPLRYELRTFDEPLHAERFKRWDTVQRPSFRSCGKKEMDIWVGISAGGYTVASENTAEPGAAVAMGPPTRAALAIHPHLCF